MYAIVEDVELISGRLVGRRTYSSVIRLKRHCCKSARKISGAKLWWLNGHGALIQVCAICFASIYKFVVFEHVFGLETK